MDTASAYPLYLAATCVNNLMAGLAGLLMYRLPYLIIDMKDFARLENINSIVSNVFSIASKAVLTFFTALFTLRQIMHAGMLIGILFSVLYTVLVLSMKIDSSTEDTGSSSIPSGAGISTRSSFSLEKLQKKEISYFHLPNFLRGISSGAMTLIALDCWAERLSGIEPDGAVTLWCAEHCDDEWMANRFQTMSIDPSGTARFQ